MDLDNIYIYLRPDTIVDRKSIFHSDFVDKFKLADSSNLSEQTHIKKYRKYKRLFNISLVISLLLAVMLIVLLAKDI